MSLKQPKKGLLFFGQTGCHKTALFKFMQTLCKAWPQRYAAHKFGYISSLDLLNRMIREQDTTLSQIPYFHDPQKTPPAFCFDELGRENSFSIYGMSYDVMSEVIRKRYEYNLVTHFATNFTKKELKDRYGQWITSRILGMTETINFPNHDQRES